MMQPEADGCTYGCAYCGTRMQVAIQGAQIAAGLAANLADTDRFLASLAQTLAQGFSEQSTIHAQGHHVEGLEVRLDPDKFVVKREGKRVVAQHQKVVRGIALKTQTMALDRWYAMLCEALAAHATANARAAWVLAQINGRR
jgi:hypothetical protein